MFELIKKIFIGLLTGLVNGFNHTKCLSLRNQKCMIQLTLINLHPNEYSQEFHYYLFAVELDRFVGSCKVCIPNKTKALNLNIFNMTTGLNESKALTKHISCECMMEENVIQINGGIMINVDVSVTNVVCYKIMFGILLHVII